VTVIGAPVAVGGPQIWSEAADQGLRTFDAAARFTTAADPAGATLAFGLLDDVFMAEAGIFENGVFVGQADGYVSIDPATGLVGIDTAASGPLAGVSLVVRASNAAGYGDLTITLSVSAAAVGSVSGVEITSSSVLTRGRCWTPHRVIFTLDGSPIDVPGDVPGGIDIDIQWNRGGSPIGGATGWNYTPVFADDATNLTVSVTATVAGSETSEEISSNQAIANPNLFQNPGFDDTSSWTLGTGWAITGGRAVKSGSTGAGTVSQTVSGLLSGQT
jgi:hypothetical protein